MKPVLVFTDYIEEHDEFVASTEIIANIGSERFVYVSPKLAERKATDQVLDHYFRLGLDDILTHAIQYLVKTGKTDMDAHGMTLMDKMSFFSVKQTVLFNNSLHQNCRETNVMLAGL